MAWRLLLRAYYLYCWLWYPLYKRIKVDSFHILINDTSIVPPLVSSEKLLRGNVKGKRILDVGTGCGIIALSAKKGGAAYVLGVDINDVAVSNAKANLRNNFSDSLSIEFKQGDLYERVCGTFDIIVSNPPYLNIIPSCKNDYKFCGGDMLERMLGGGKEHLAPEGEIRILYPSSEMPGLERLASKYDYIMERLDHTPNKSTLFLRLLLRLTINPKLSVYVFRASQFNSPHASEHN